MNILIAVLFIAAWSPKSQASIAYVQSASVVVNPGSSVTATYASAQNAGDLNVVIIGWGGKGSIPPGTAPSSVTDSKGNTYLLAVGPTGNSTGNGSQSIYYASNIPAASAGSNSVTVSFGTTSFAHLSVQIAEYSGVATSSPLDGTSAAIGTNATVNSGSVTTTNANDLLVGGDYLDAATGAAGSGFTLRVASTYNNILEDQIVTTTGSYAATAPVTGPDWWIIQIAAFKAAGGGSAAPSAPTSLSASKVSPTQVNLAWTASTAGTGGAVNGYRVERCAGAFCTTFAQIGTPTGTSYSDTTAAPSTSYSYRVRASDAAGDLSAYSNVAAASTGIVYMQSSVATLNPGSSVTATYANAQNAGDFNVVTIGWGGKGSIPPGTAPSSVTDSKGNTYVLAVGPTGNSTGNGSQSIYYATNIAAASAGSNSVTVSFGATSFAHLALQIAEYSGVATSSPLDGTSAAVGTNATVNSGSVTTTNANDLLVGGDYLDAGTGAAGSGFTLRVVSANNTVLEDQIVSSTGSYAATAPVSGPDWWIIQVAAFKAASGASGAPSAPAGLSASTVSPTQINLTWSASTAGSGGAVNGYRVERCAGASCTSFAQIGTPTGTSYSDTSVSPSTSYSYRVRASDTAGDLSAYSNVASAGTGIAYIQSASVVVNPGSSVTATYASAQNAGDLNIVIIGWGGKGSIPPGTAPSSVADSKGNTYVLAVGPTGNSTGNGSQSIYYARNIVAAAAGSNSVTVSFGATSFAHLSVQIAEYSGIATSSPLDGTSAAIGTNATVTSGSVTTTNANDLLVGGDYLDAATGAAGSGFTLRVASAYNNILEDQIVTTTGSYAATAPVTGPDWWIIQVAAFKAAGGSGGGSGTPSVPTGLVVTDVSNSQITLTWNPSTDSGTNTITGYLIYRCQGVGCSSFTQIGISSTASFNDVGLSANTSYSYEVVATDSGGNSSADSSESTADTNLVFTYTYDSANRVIHATGSNGTSFTYTYDANGNRTSVTSP